MRILVVEDDPRLANLLAKGLRERGYAIDLAEDGELGLNLANMNEYDGIVLDIGLPKIDGLKVAELLRDQGNAVPILMLTARDTVADRVNGLETGADDYLVKPFDFSELVARLRALLRRQPVVRPNNVQIDDLVIDTGGQRAKRGERVIELTAKEFQLLEFLARRTGEVVSRSDIVAHVWDDNHDPASNSIEVYINRLRKKIDAPGEQPLIHTKRGAGYLIGVDTTKS